MELDEALSIISEIATGDNERRAFLHIKDSIVGLINDLESYRSLYESATKKMERFRDIASKPDLPDAYLKPTNQNDTDNQAN